MLKERDSNDVLVRQDNATSKWRKLEMIHPEDSPLLSLGLWLITSTYQGGGHSTLGQWWSAVDKTRSTGAVL